MPINQVAKSVAVVEVEAAQIVLVGLAVAAVLGDDQPGHRLEHFGRTQERTGRQLLAAHRALGGAAGHADQIRATGLHLDGLQGGHTAREGSPGQERGDHPRRYAGKTFHPI